MTSPLPEPVVKEPRVVKADAFDPVKIGVAYERFLTGDSMEDLCIELDIPKKVLAYHASKGGWNKHRGELLQQFNTDADQRYLALLGRERLSTTERHLRIASKTELAAENLVDQLLAESENGIIDDKVLRRLTESIASITTVSARAAGITDRPAPVGGGDHHAGGKAPLITLNVVPQIAGKEEPGVTIDVTDYVTEDKNAE
jgi:hypothetical protein